MGFCGVERLGLTIILSQQKRMILTYTDMIMGITLGLITWLLGGAS